MAGQTSAVSVSPASMQETLERGVQLLLMLATKPVAQLVVADVAADDLELVANLLLQIAARKRTAKAA